MRRAAALLVVLAGLAACGIKGEPASPQPDVPPIPRGSQGGGLDF